MDTKKALNTKGNRLFDIPLNIRQRFGDEHAVFLRYESGAIAAIPAWKYIENSNNFSSHLIDLGLKKGDRVVTIINNSPEWNFAEIGILQAGGIHVSLSPLYTDEQLGNILNLVNPVFTLASSPSISQRLQSVVDRLSVQCRHLNIKTADLFSRGYLEKKVETRKKSITPDDIAAVLFTSGSAGMPKGVILTHKNILTSVNEFSGTDLFRNCSRSISFLQLSQSGEKKVNYSCQVNGISACYPASHKSLVGNIELFQPQITALVPFLLSELHLEMEASRGTESSIRTIICGGASVPARLIDLYKQKSIDVYEVYGLTETASLLAYNTPRDCKAGTVGRIADSTQVSFTTEGEVLVKGDCVMKGYLLPDFKFDPACDEEGWFHTGDIGELDEEDFLTITGRKKNAFKNSRGSYIYPEEIEQELNKILHFDHVMIIGDNADSLSVILKLHDSDSANQINKNKIRDSLRQFNEGKRDELKISQFMLLNGKVSKDFLSVTLKLNRKKISELSSDYKFIPVYR